MNIIYIVTTLISVFSIFLLITQFFERVRILKLSVIAGMLFVIEYLLISSVFLFFDLFRVKYVLLASLIINIGALFACIDRIKKKISIIDFDIKKSIFSIFIIVIILPFISLKSQSISAGYDAGIYGMKAIDLLYGDTSATKTLKEYELVDGEIRDKLIALQTQQVGLYQKPTNESIYKYDYHALPTWPALMALSGKIFGLTNITQILTFLFIASALMIMYIMENLKVERYSRYMVFLVYAFLPLGVYLAKNSLSEMLFGSIVLLSLFLLTEKDSFFKIVSGISMGLLGFIHLTIIPYFPAIFGIILLLFIIRKDFVYIKANMIFCTCFVLSIIYAFKVTEMYTTFQLINMFGSSIKTKALLIIIVTLGIICFIILACANYLIKEKKVKIFDNIDILLEKHGTTIVKIIIIIIALFTFYNGYKLCFTDAYIHGEGGTWSQRSNYAGRGLLSLPYLNIFSIISATAFISLPIFVYKLFIKKIELDYKEKLLFLMFLFAMAVNTIIKIDTPKNYYASRYFYIFVVIFALILLGLMIKTKRGAVIACLIALIPTIPFNVLLLKSVEYDGNWNILNDTLSLIERESIVLCDLSGIQTNRVLVNNLREINENMIFSADSKEEISKIFNNREIYLISQNPLSDKKYDKIFEKTYTITGEIAGKWYYPLKHNKSSIKLFIYKKLQGKTEINMQPDDIGYMDGFHALEKNKNGNFSWTGNKSSFTLSFEPIGTSTVRVHYHELPQYVFTKYEIINIAAKINDKLLISKDISAKSNKEGYFDIIIPEELIINEWDHKITLECDTWSPKEFGGGRTDSRKLGIAISKIELLESED